ncbi:hypothetical protein D3C80_1591840 [compost metagenome]
MRAFGLDAVDERIFHQRLQNIFECDKFLNLIIHLEHSIKTLLETELLNNQVSLDHLQLPGNQRFRAAFVQHQPVKFGQRI